MSHAIQYIKGIFQTTIFSVPEIHPIPVVILIAIFLFIEWVFRDKDYGLQFDNTKTHKITRWSTYIIISFLIASFFGKGSSFIYFQF